jgi:hypothetical protein
MNEMAKPENRDCTESQLSTLAAAHLRLGAGSHAWAWLGSPSWVLALLCCAGVLWGQFRTSKTDSFDVFTIF